jgi:hypothetical protein
MDRDISWFLWWMSQNLREIIEVKVQGKLKWGVVSENIAILEIENGEEPAVGHLSFGAEDDNVGAVVDGWSVLCWRRLTSSIHRSASLRILAPDWRPLFKRFDTYCTSRFETRKANSPVPLWSEPSPPRPPNAPSASLDI